MLKSSSVRELSLLLLRAPCGLSLWARFAVDALNFRLLSIALLRPWLRLMLPVRLSTASTGLVLPPASRLEKRKLLSVDNILTSRESSPSISISLAPSLPASG